jgi:hypothetical protein
MIQSPYKTRRECFFGYSVSCCFYDTLRALLRPLESSGGALEDKIMRENGREAVRVGAIP